MTDNGVEYVFTLPDGSKRYEIVFERREAFTFAKMHGAKSFAPVSREGKESD